MDNTSVSCWCHMIEESAKDQRSKPINNGVSQALFIQHLQYIWGGVSQSTAVSVKKGGVSQNLHFIKSTNAGSAVKSGHFQPSKQFLQSNSFLVSQNLLKDISYFFICLLNSALDILSLHLTNTFFLNDLICKKNNKDILRVCSWRRIRKKHFPGVVFSNCMLTFRVHLRFDFQVGHSNKSTTLLELPNHIF